MKFSRDLKTKLERVDLVDLDDLPSNFRKSIEKDGIVLYAN